MKFIHLFIFLFAANSFACHPDFVPKEENFDGVQINSYRIDTCLHDKGVSEGVINLMEDPNRPKIIIYFKDHSKIILNKKQASPPQNSSGPLEVKYLFFKILEELDVFSQCYLGMTNKKRNRWYKDWLEKNKKKNQEKFFDKECLFLKHEDLNKLKTKEFNQEYYSIVKSIEKSNEINCEEKLHYYDPSGTYFHCFFRDHFNVCSFDNLIDIKLNLRRNGDYYSSYKDILNSILFIIESLRHKPKNIKHRDIEAIAFDRAYIGYKNSNSIYDFRKNLGQKGKLPSYKAPFYDGLYYSGPLSCNELHLYSLIDVKYNWPPHEANNEPYLSIISKLIDFGYYNPSSKKIRAYDFLKAKGMEISKETFDEVCHFNNLFVNELINYKKYFFENNENKKFFNDCLKAVQCIKVLDKNYYKQHSYPYVFYDFSSLSPLHRKILTAFILQSKLNMDPKTMIEINIAQDYFKNDFSFFSREYKFKDAFFIDPRKEIDNENSQKIILNAKEDLDYAFTWKNLNSLKNIMNTDDLILSQLKAYDFLLKNQKEVNQENIKAGSFLLENDESLTVEKFDVALTLLKKYPRASERPRMDKKFQSEKEESNFYKKRAQTYLKATDYLLNTLKIDLLNLDKETIQATYDLFEENGKYQNSFPNNLQNFEKHTIDAMLIYNRDWSRQSLSEIFPAIEELMKRKMGYTKEHVSSMDHIMKKLDGEEDREIAIKFLSEQKKSEKLNTKIAVFFIKNINKKEWIPDEVEATSRFCSLLWEKSLKLRPKEEFDWESNTKKVDVEATLYMMHELKIDQFELEDVQASTHAMSLTEKPTWNQIKATRYHMTQKEEGLERTLPVINAIAYLKSKYGLNEPNNNQIKAMMRLQELNDSEPSLERFEIAYCFVQLGFFDFQEDDIKTGGVSAQYIMKCEKLGEVPTKVHFIATKHLINDLKNPTPSPEAIKATVLLQTKLNISIPNKEQIKAMMHLLKNRDQFSSKFAYNRNALDAVVYLQKSQQSPSASQIKNKIKEIEKRAQNIKNKKN